MMNNKQMFAVSRDKKKAIQNKLDYDIQQEIDKQSFVESENLKTNEAFENWAREVMK